MGKFGKDKNRKKRIANKLKHSEKKTKWKYKCKQGKRKEDENKRGFK